MASFCVKPRVDMGFTSGDRGEDEMKSRAQTSETHSGQRVNTGRSLLHHGDYVLK